MCIKSTQHINKQQSNAAALNLLTFVASEWIIVCTSCKVAVPFQNLNTYLRVAYKLPFRLTRTIVVQFNGLLAAQTSRTLSPARIGLRHSLILPRLLLVTPVNTTLCSRV